MGIQPHTNINVTRKEITWSLFKHGYMQTLFYKNPLFCKHTLQYLQSLALLLCLLFFSNTLYAESKYIKCWKNARGLTECGNRIPREFYNQRIRYIDSTGVTRKVKERTKTREELKAEKESKRLLALKEKQQRKLESHDQVLLKTYLTIDDLLSSLNSRLSLIESQGSVLNSTIAIKKRDFDVLVKKAAGIERSGKPISKQLALELDRARNELKNIQTQVTSNQLEDKKIKKTFALDVERFILAKSKRIQHSLTSEDSDKLHALRFSCTKQSQCDLQWKKAVDFIKKHATTKMLYQTDTISVTDTPVKHQDIAMTLSSFTDKTDDPRQLIFQIRCNRARQGEEFCSGEKVSNLLKKFSKLIN